MPTNDLDLAKRRAAERAAEFVRPGMRLGLGTGSTAKHFVDCVGELVKSGVDLLCVPTSETTRAQAQAQGVPLTTLDETPALDLTVDGADEFDARLRLIKGGGGALLREKIVASASARMIVIADGSKESACLGRFPLPVEVAPFGLAATRAKLETVCRAFGCAGNVTPRRAAGGGLFITDGGHYIVDCAFGAISDPEGLCSALEAIPGVMEHGLFIGLARTVIVADAAGVRILGDLTETPVRQEHPT